jgi:hypothetical protein
LENIEGRDHLLDLEIYHGIILKWMLEKQGVKTCTEFNWLGIGPYDGLFGTTSDPIEGGIIGAVGTTTSCSRRRHTNVHRGGYNISEYIFSFSLVSCGVIKMT